MKILFLTDMPPCVNYTGGLMIDQLLKFFDKKDVALCCVQNKHLKPDIPREWENIPSLNLTKPYERSLRLLPKKLGLLTAIILEFLQSLYTKYYITPKIVNFIKSEKIDTIFVVLQKQTITNITYNLLNKTDIPIYAHTQGSAEWWLRYNKIDFINRRIICKKYHEIILNSKGISTASIAMSQLYKKMYNKDSIALIDGLSQSLAKPPASSINSGNDFIIAMAGQSYARQEWECLVELLNDCGWKIAGKNIKIRIMANSFEYKANNHGVNFEYLGWNSRQDLLNNLATADLLYLPYWFSKEFRLEAESSFPSKLVAYYASGRPVLCHAPHYASPTKYVAENNAGFICSFNEKDKLLEIITQAITKPDLYKLYAENGSKCFHRDMTTDIMRHKFFELLGKNKQ